jgi:hypothetical protein
VLAIRLPGGGCRVFRDIDQAHRDRRSAVPGINGTDSTDARRHGDAAHDAQQLTCAAIQQRMKDGQRAGIVAIGIDIGVKYETVTQR